MLKKNIKLIIGFLIGVILASGITAYAAGIFANQVTYKNGKTVEEALNELYNRGSFVSVDSTYLQSGSLVGNATITSNNWNSTAGLSITGNTAGRNSQKTDNRWEKDIDLTNVSLLTFFAKKGTDHGGVYINIDDTKICEINYHQFYNDWIGYYVDLSEYQGTHKLTLCGGYIDDTGFTNSNTQYCDIRIYYN